MLTAGIAKECPTKPKVLNPLLVSTKGKKRMILNLRYVNNQLFKDKITFDDWNSFLNYMECNKYYLFKFDLKCGYHHLDIFDEKSLSWPLTAGRLIRKHIIYCNFVINKVVRPLIKYWRLYAIRIACFLDDGLSIEFGYQSRKLHQNSSVTP